GGQLGIAFRASIAAAAVVLEDASTQRHVGCLLVRLAEGGVDAETACVHLVRVTLGHRLPHHLGGVFTMDGVFVCLAPRPPRRQNRKRAAPDKSGSRRARGSGPWSGCARSGRRGARRTACAWLFSPRRGKSCAPPAS